MKQCSRRPAEAVVCWYENLTLSTPLKLYRAGGFCTVLPALKRAHAFRTGGTGIGGIELTLGAATGAGAPELAGENAIRETEAVATIVDTSKGFRSICFRSI